MGAERKALEPCTIVIFGASGDLTARKLIPGVLPPVQGQADAIQVPHRGLCAARKDRRIVAAGIARGARPVSRTKPVDEKVWKISPRMWCIAGATSPMPRRIRNWRKLLTSFGSGPLRENLLFYLATQPSQFGQVVEELHRAALLHKEGRRLATHRRRETVRPRPRSAHALNNELTRYAYESQVCRIDHYLGKETVVNILMFRFSNSIFEKLWNRNSVDHVQITISNLGVGERGGYYEEAGALRDMAQNHVLRRRRRSPWNRPCP